MAKDKVLLGIGACLVCIVLILAFSFRDRVQDKAYDHEQASPLPVDTETLETQTYTSSKLGITFKYRARWEGYPIEIREEGNTIRFAGSQSIEVFPKDPKQSLDSAITERFLNGYDSSKCWVAHYDQEIPGDPERAFPPSYVHAGITYPKPTDTNTPFWEHAGDCPSYSETNGARFFMMDTEVPDRFIFVELGQDSPASDGENEEHDWSRSIRIMPLADE